MGSASAGSAAPVRVHDLAQAAAAAAAQEEEDDDRQQRADDADRDAHAADRLAGHLHAQLALVAGRAELRPPTQPNSQRFDNLNPEPAAHHEQFALVAGRAELGAPT